MATTPDIHGQSDAVAVTVAAALNAASDAGAFCLDLHARRLFARKLDVADISVIGSPVTVEVIPGNDMADLVGLDGTFDDTYGCHVILLQNIVDSAGTTGGIDESAASMLLRLRGELVEYLCQHPINCDANTVVHPFSLARVKAIRNGPEGVYDLSRLEQINVFYSEIIVTYKAAGLRRRIG